MLNASRLRARRAQALKTSKDGQRDAGLSDEARADEADEVSFAEEPAFDFARDCGAADGISVRVEPSRDHPRDVSVASGMVLVGRGPQCTLQLPESDVAEKHLLALYLQGQFFVCDLGSPNGTWHDSGKVTHAWFPSGTALQVGNSRIVLEGPATPAAPELVEANDDGLWLRFPQSSEGDQRYRIKKSVTLFGRDSRCRVRIPSRAVSRFHCVLVRTAAGAWVADLGSREGIQVNGRRVGMARIEDDCELTVGRTTLFLHHGHEFPDAPPESGLIVGGGISEEVVATLLAEIRAAQREAVAEIGGMLRDVLKAVSRLDSKEQRPQLETAIKKIERRIGMLR